MPINRQVLDVLRKFPDLSFNKDLNEISGSLDVGQKDIYDVRISLAGYPSHFPSVWETGERIPKSVHRHIYSDTRSCCFTTAAKAQILLRTKIKSLVSFIEDILVPYLRNNSYYEINGSYSTDEYSHDRTGIVEAYKDILGIRSVSRIVEVIEGRLKGKVLTPRSRCYCGSGQKLGSCNTHRHFKAYKEFSLINKSLLRHDLNSTLVDFLKSEQVK